MDKMIIYRILALCILIILCYVLGLSGGFLFDDFANLPALGKYGGIKTLSDLWAYISKGIAGPTGRPISLLTFLLNANDWPTDPWPFKITNLILHITTTLLLYWLIYRILVLYRSTQETKRAMNIAWLATAMWALHPFFVSTTLYIVQRMTILAALFVVIGLLTYVHGRSLLQHRPKAAYIWMTFGLGINTILAVLSKENGALLPLLALIVEYSIFRHQQCKLPKPSKLWEIAILWIPASSTVLYLIYKLPDFTYGYNIRHFNLHERLLTESAIITDYLYHLIIPKIQTRGVFNDNFPVISSIASPEAMFSISLLLLLLLIAVLLHKRYPFITLAIFFFFTAHIIESTVIPLELYFEHRNYLPGILFFIPLAIGIQKTVDIDKRLFYTVSVSITLLLTTFSAARSNLWGNTDTQMLVWAKQNPTSQRAQRSAAIALYNRGKHLQAIEFLEKASNQIPESMTIQLHLLTYKCQISTIGQDSFRDWIIDLNKHNYDFRTYKLVENFIEQIVTDRCKGVSEKEGHIFLDMLAKKPALKKFPSAMVQITHTRGVLFAYENRPTEALNSFKQSLKVASNIEAGLLGTAILATKGHITEAIELLKITKNRLDTIKDKELKRPRNTYRKEIAILNSKLIRNKESAK